MAVVVVSEDPDRTWDDLVLFREAMEWPEGSKVEVVDGVVTVSPVAALRHNLITEDVQRRLYSVIPEDWGIFQMLSVAVPSRLGMFIPDLVVASMGECVGSGTYIAAPRAKLVAEVTSRFTAERDRGSKAAAYAAAGIPLYLLVDRWAPGGPTVTLYGEPKDDVYRVLSAVKFGDTVHLPKPFDVAIDTSEFPVD